MKRARKALITLTVVMMASGYAGGTDWRSIGSNKEVEILVDVQSIKDVPGAHEVVSATLYKQVQKAPGVPAFQATVARMSFKCLTAKGSLSSLDFYATRDLKGPTVAKYRYPEAWRPVDPTSDVGVVWKYVCTQTGKRQVDGL